MANTLITPTAVTREALRILHQKLRFLGTVNSSYDDSFAKAGAKIGDTLKIRMPNAYTVREGRAMQAQDTVEQTQDMTIAHMRGVDMTFTTQELTLSMDDFSKRILRPAITQLAAHIENHAMSMYKDVYQEVSDIGATITFRDVLKARQRLVSSLAPIDENMTVQLHPTDNLELVDALKGLYNDQGEVARQYREGKITTASGFTFYENTFAPTHVTGTEAGADTGANVNGANQTGSSVLVNGTVTGTFKKGDIVSFEGTYEVHPESKAVSSKLKQFVVTSDVAANYSSIPISPAIVTTGGRQNVSASPTTTGIVYKQESDDTTAIAGSADHTISLAYHKDAFAFVSADLEIPPNVTFSSREQFEGVSIRVIRNYDINSDLLPCRLDVLYGFKTIRPELACRLAFN